MRRLACLVLAGGLLGGCGGSPTSPSDAPVRVTIMPLPTPFGNPGTASFAVTIENLTSSQANMTFPTSCQVLPHFLNRASGREVTPVGGGLACATVVSQLSLQPGLSVSQVFFVKGGTAPESNVIVVPPGDYFLYATLEDTAYKVKSPQLSLTVQ